MARTRLGQAAAEAFRADLTAGAYIVDWWPTAHQESAKIANKYIDFDLSLADASLVALAARIETGSIASFDERHFRAVTPLTKATAFTLLPADSMR